MLKQGGELMHIVPYEVESLRRNPIAIGYWPGRFAIAVASPSLN